MWDDLKRLERLAYGARKSCMDGVLPNTEARDYETRVNRAEMGDDLDDYHD